MQKRKRLLLLLLCLGCLMVLLLVLLFRGNTTLTVTHITVRDDKLPAGFSGCRIAHISDLHSAEFGSGNRRLLDLLSAEAPDLIVITGDLVDRRNTNFDIAASFVRAAVQIAPTFYVSGNHEATLLGETDYEDLKKALLEAGVTVLDNATVSITRSDSVISLAGISDPDFVLETYHRQGISAASLGLDATPVVRDNLLTVPKEDGTYQILLAHRPELIQLYADHGSDLVFSGHAHGGQVRLPFLGALWTPGEGFFPTYDAGLYTVEDTNLVVSRGLGNSSFPFRINNPPEIVLVTLA